MYLILKMMSKAFKIAITGHRPDKLDNEWNGNGPLSTLIRDQLQDLLRKPVRAEGIVAISGMALGVDMLWAETALYDGYNLVAALPCRDQDNFWRPDQKERYQAVLRHKNARTHYVNYDYSSRCMQQRNEWMVDNCDLLIAVWDGSAGGTKNCVDYAVKVGKQIHYIDVNKLRTQL